MMQTLNPRRVSLSPIASLILMIGLVVGGCKREENGPAQTAGGGSPTTAATATPQVGKPFATAEQYKPVPGKRGGRMVRDQLGEPKSFNPIVASETSTTDYTQRAFEGLTRGNAFTGKTEPLLAEKWETSEDGLTWTFHLRKDVKFNDGTPFTAHDVEFTWNDLVYDIHRPADKKEPRWPCSMRDLTTFDGKIVKVEATDDYTVKFTLPVRIAIWDDLMGEPFLCSKAKWAPAVAAGTFGGMMGADANLKDVVSTGPWVVGQYVRGEKVVLKRNPNYWRKDSAGQPLPYLDELVFLITRSLDLMYLNFERGVTDIFNLRSGKDVAALRPKQQAGNFDLYQLGPAHSTAFLALNMNEEAARAKKVADYKVAWFRDARFRRAISHAVDRGSMVRNIYRGLGYPQYAPFSSAPGPFRMDVEPYVQDVAKAKSLLAEMGLTDRNGDGVIEDGAGHKVSFTIVTNAGNNVREEMCNYIATDLRKLGIEVNVLFLEFNQLVDKLDVNFDWEAMVMGFTSGWDPHGGSNFWKSNSENHLWWPKQAKPGFPWEQRIDEIFTRGVQELDRDKRRAMYQEWIKIVRDEQPVVYLAIPERVDAIRKRFGNVFPSPGPLTEFASFHNEEELYVLDGQDK